MRILLPTIMTPRSSDARNLFMVDVLETRIILVLFSNTAEGASEECFRDAHCFFMLINICSNTRKQLKHVHEYSVGLTKILLE